MDFNNTYTPFEFNQSTINSNNTLLHDVDPSNFKLDLTIDSKYYTSDEFNLNHKSIFQHGLNVININVRSLKKNFDKLSLLLTSFSIYFDIISVTESWLNVDNNFVFDIPDYNTVLSSRVHKRGGGVIIDVKISHLIYYL